MNVEVTIEFLLAEGARFDARQQQIQHELDRAIRIGIRAYRQLSASQRRLEDQQRRTDATLDRLAEQQRKTDASLDRLAAQQRETEATLNAFIRIVERRFADNRPS